MSETDQLNQIGTTKYVNVTPWNSVGFPRQGYKSRQGNAPTRQQHVILWLAMPGQKLGQKHRPRWFDPVNTRHSVIGHTQITVFMTRTYMALWHYSYGFSGKTQVKKLDLCWCDVNHSLRKNVRSEQAAIEQLTHKKQI